MAPQGPYNRQEPLKSTEGLSNDELRILLEKTIEDHPELAGEVNARLDRMRQATGERLKAASKVEETAKKKELSPEEQEELLGTLRNRFERNPKLHEGIQWSAVEKSLKAAPEKMWSLQQLEATGGEPDVIAEEKGEYIFGDCSAESPIGRRNIVFDAEAEEWLKEHSPNEKCNGNAVDIAAEYGVDLMSEEQYRALQKNLQLDRNTWSWLKTPADIRKTGGALNGYRVVGAVHVDQDSARDYNDDRAFRASLRVKKA